MTASARPRPAPSSGRSRGNPARRAASASIGACSSGCRARLDRHHRVHRPQPDRRGDQFLTADRPRRSCRADGWFPRRGEFGIATLIVGTLLVTVIAMLIAAPVGLLSRDLPGRVRQPARARHRQADPRDPGRHPERRPRLLRPHVHQPERRPDARPERRRASTWSRPAVAVGILTIPLIASISEDAMRAVPRSLREASYGLGARRVTTATARRGPGGDLGHRRRDHPRHLARDRRDDGRGHRGRRVGRLAAHAGTRSSRARR